MFSCSSAAVTFETPSARILPWSLKASSAAIVSAMGVKSGGTDGQWVWYRSMQSTPSRLRLFSISIRRESGRRLRYSFFPSKPALGSDDDLVAAAFDGLADDDLAAAKDVGRRAVYEIDAQIDRCLDGAD